MFNYSIPGTIWMNQFGGVEVALLPRPGETGKDFKRLESNELRSILQDHYRFFVSGQEEGKVHGKSVTVGLSKNGRRKMNFMIGFLNVLLLGTDPAKATEAEDHVKVTLIIELPFSDPATARQTNTDRRGG